MPWCRQSRGEGGYVDSISSATLTTIGQTPTELSSPSSTQSSTGKTVASIPPTAPDLIEISTIPRLSQAEQIQSTNPSQYQTVLTDAVRELKAAALKTNDPLEVAYLLDLAGKFQQLQETGGSPPLSGAVAAGH
jgi:hypothetical protein